MMQGVHRERNLEGGRNHSPNGHRSIFENAFYFFPQNNNTNHQ